MIGFWLHEKKRQQYYAIFEKKGFYGNTQANVHLTTSLKVSDNKTTVLNYVSRCESEENTETQQEKLENYNIKTDTVKSPKSMILGDMITSFSHVVNMFYDEKNQKLEPPGCKFILHKGWWETLSVQKFVMYQKALRKYLVNSVEKFSFSCVLSCPLNVLPVFLCRQCMLRTLWNSVNSIQIAHTFRVHAIPRNEHRETQRRRKRNISLHDVDGIIGKSPCKSTFFCFSLFDEPGASVLRADYTSKWIWLIEPCFCQDKRTVSDWHFLDQVNHRLPYPLLLKSLYATGHPTAHSISIVWNEHQLEEELDSWLGRSLTLGYNHGRLFTVCLQPFIPHAAVLKVYVAGHDFHQCVPKSPWKVSAYMPTKIYRFNSHMDVLGDSFRPLSEDKNNLHFFINKNLPLQKKISKLVHELCMMLEHRVDFFGFDVLYTPLNNTSLSQNNPQRTSPIRELCSATPHNVLQPNPNLKCLAFDPGNFFLTLVDLNYLPSYKGVPDVSKAIVRCFSKRLG